MIRELIGYVGLVIIAAGVWMLSHPAGVIVAGGVLVLAAVFSGETKKKARN